MNGALAVTVVILGLCLSMYFLMTIINLSDKHRERKNH